MEEDSMPTFSFLIGLLDDLFVKFLVIWLPLVHNRFLDPEELGVAFQEVQRYCLLALVFNVTKPLEAAIRVVLINLSELSMVL